MLPYRKMKAVSLVNVSIHLPGCTVSANEPQFFYLNLLANCSFYMMRDISGSDIIFFFGGWGTVRPLTFNEALHSGSRLCFRFEVDESA
jgi:hypothetical protein